MGKTKNWAMLGFPLRPSDRGVCELPGWWTSNFFSPRQAVLFESPLFCWSSENVKIWTKTKKTQISFGNSENNLYSNAGQQQSKEFTNIPLEDTPDPQSTVYICRNFVHLFFFWLPGVCFKDILGFFLETTHPTSLQPWHSPWEMVSPSFPSANSPAPHFQATKLRGRVRTVQGWPPGMVNEIISSQERSHTPLED